MEHVGVIEYIDIQYTKTRGDVHYGRSKWHTLFEETAHAVDYENGRYGLRFKPWRPSSDPRTLSVQFIVHDLYNNTRKAETSAWYFAAKNAPALLSRIRGYHSGTDPTTRIQLYGRVQNTIIKDIRAMKSYNHAAIEQLLYQNYRMYVANISMGIQYHVDYDPTYK